MSAIQSLGYSEQHDLRILAKALQLFREVRNAMSVQMVQTFLAVASIDPEGQGAGTAGVEGDVGVIRN